MGEVLTITMPSTKYPEFTAGTIRASNEPEHVYTLGAASYFTSVWGGDIDDIVDLDDLEHINKSREAYLNGDLVDPNEVFAYLES
ncbi:MAG: hypothetical protein HY420_01290 [Candidatus Kerfeldbacteria bacterium]|nr:hypothetical protein [Candidatus Kerfeldbacteria bacterium]